MRITIDLQGAQTEGSRYRGIGRGTLYLTKQMLQIDSPHTFEFLLNANYAEAMQEIKTELSPLSSRILWKEYTYPVLDKPYFRKIAQVLISQAYGYIQPDLLYISSSFEGLSGKAVPPVWPVCSPHTFTSAMLHDLIPYVFKDIYLAQDHIYQWYQQRLQFVKCADLLLVQSNASRADGIHYLEIPPEKIVNISAGVDEKFHPMPLTPTEKQAFLHQYQINKKILLYTSGIDYRKNIENLIKAFANIPVSLRQLYQLVIVCKVLPSEKNTLLTWSKRCGLNTEDVIFTDFIPDNDLVIFYNLCHLFIFPSLYEGFGLPILEAMSCGAPVIGSNTSSMPEIINFKEALFDPHSVENITACLTRSLQDSHFLETLSAHGLHRAKAFSWKKSAKIAIAAFEAAYERKQSQNKINPASYPNLSPSQKIQLTQICIQELADILSQHPHTEEDLYAIEKAIIQNNLDRKDLVLCE